MQGTGNCSNILRKCGCSGRIDAGNVSMRSRFGKLRRCIDSSCTDDIPTTNKNLIQGKDHRFYSGIEDILQDAQVI